MKTFQGFETIEIDAASDGVIIRQEEPSQEHPSAVFIPAHMVKAVIRAIRQEWAEVERLGCHEGAE